MIPKPTYLPPNITGEYFSNFFLSKDLKEKKLFNWHAAAAIETQQIFRDRN